MTRSGNGDNYEIGYRKPPKKNRFKKGQSGNPKGRPKGGKNLKTDILEELAERIAVQEGGKVKKITKQRAMVKSLVAKGIKGDAKTTTSLFAMVFKMLGDEIDANEDLQPTASDLEILERFEERLREKILAEAKSDAE
ncbi:DUF5681 domain-containing protein [Pyruvatibacter sp.]